MTIHIPETNLKEALAAGRFRAVFRLLDGFYWLYGRRDW